MNEIEKANAEFDEKISINKAECCFCKTELTACNKSGYRLFFERDNTYVLKVEKNAFYF